MAYMKDSKGRRLDSFEVADRIDSRARFVPRSESVARVLRRAPANRAASGWSIPAQTNKDVTNSTADYTTDAYFGDRCMRIVTSGTAAQVYGIRTMNTTFDATDCNVRITFKVMDSNFTAITLVVANSSASLASTATIGFVGGSNGAGSAVQPNRWITLDIPKSKFAGTADWANIQLVRIGITDVSGSPTDLRVHSFDFIQRDPLGTNPNGLVVITADDSHPTQYTVLKDKLAARGWRATLMPIPGSHGTNSTTYLTDEQVIDLHDNYGWEVGAHCYDVSSHAKGLPNLTSEQRINEFEQVKAWQKALGFYSPSHSYPLGTHDAATEADVAKYWVASRLASSHGFNETSTPARRYSIQAENITQGAAALGTAATKAHTDKGVLIIMLHQILESGGDANTVNAATLDAVLAAIAASGCDVVTMAEALERMDLI